MKIRTSQSLLWEQADRKCIQIEQTVEHNINHEVQVKLTHYGMEIWRQTRFDVFSDRWRNRQATEDDYAEFRENFAKEVAQHHAGDGWYEFQTYDLWDLFGKYCFNGAVDPPFETTVRYVEKTTKIIQPSRA